MNMSASARLDQSFVRKWERFCVGREDIAVTLGITAVSGDSKSVVLRLALRPAISQPAGMFSAASLFGLADIAGTFLAMEQMLPDQFPLAVQSNVHLLGNVRSGTAEAKARLIKAGKTLIVTDTTVTSLDEGRLLASVQTTYLNPS
ncbi:PaaI family thioesterase [Pseudarthrobacter sp. fls2-241-R2A-168]|uniref:PaaI family thioesterase n=1 Tax=Pseudarthrobacter sp. fls2-241-R2A-168 TaxID=3040304 RepID=UPI0025563F86|nr:PaaI family thioesterase [Pseudarthrobacter sp. fls2-241-R2A-168]